MKEKTDDRITTLDEDKLEQVTGGLDEPFVPGAQQGPGPSPGSQTGGIPASSPIISSDGFRMACWRSDTMVHMFVLNERGEEVCKYCGAVKPALT
ncbi:MAG: hypothetical protein IKO68_09775 [Oscillospiraceae bacterium]|nr:hypothetical protein [Oscillospiraceae bacterium]